MKITLSSALEMLKALKERRKQLEELLKETSNEISWRDSSQKEKRPLYDVVKVDEKIVILNNALFELSSLIKQVNARVEIDLELDFKQLMSPILNKAE